MRRCFRRQLILSSNAHTHSIYYSIYIAPPIGDRRFAGPDCWQVVDPVMNPQVHGMSEDCLSVNVFSPAGSSSNRRVPVMVWLHGGAFQLGGAHRPEYDGRRLAERGVVVVTLNYRLGALGFLVSRSDGITGNFGLMDQRAALYWVREHIAVFGGVRTCNLGWL